MLRVPGAGAIEGKGALQVGSNGSLGIGLFDPRLANLASSRAAISFWGLAEGAEPVLEVVYGPTTASAGPFHFARVVAVRTGRETSDGWAEYTTGTIDGSAWGFGIRAVYLTLQRTTQDGASIVIDARQAPDSGPSPVLDPSTTAKFDAIEIRAVPGVPMAASVCTQANVSSTCAPNAECLFGRCFDSTFSWGPSPPAADRSQLLNRTGFLFAHIMGDRMASKTAETDFLPGAAALQPVEPLFDRLNRLTATLRDSHTKLGTPPSYSSMFYPFASSSSSTLDVCFGVVTNDVAPSSAPSFAVTGVESASALSGALQVGDVIKTIDNQPAAGWIASVWPSYSTSLPNDSRADPSAVANVLPSLIGRRASTMMVSRCTVGSGCVDRPPIAVGESAWKQVSKTGTWGGGTRSCSQRFRPAVSQTPVDPDLPISKVSGGITYVQFDGFSPEDREAFKSAWQSIFASPGKVLIDARAGHGGYCSLGSFLVRLLRGTESPMGQVVKPRSSINQADSSWLFSSAWDECSDPDTSTQACSWAGDLDFFPITANPVGASSKIAWVNADDVSVNDVCPRLLQGRINLRIFGPHATHGAYGAVTSLPPLLGAWSPGSLQIFDTRFGTTPQNAKAALWESGHGVVPDLLVLQKVSDLLQNRDTLLDAARTWLEAP